jgi:hypothetical protein
VNVVAMLREPSAVVQADGAGPDDGDASSESVGFNVHSCL